MFNKVFTITEANKIWLKLQELHDSSSNFCEQKYCLVKQSYDSFLMLPNELVKDMYSHLNLTTNELNAIGLTMVSSIDVVRKIFFVLPLEKYMHLALTLSTTCRVTLIFKMHKN